MHWVIDLHPLLGDREALARWCRRMEPAEPEWDRIRSVSRALPGSWDAGNHRLGQRLLQTCHTAVQDAIGVPVWPVSSNLRLCRHGAHVPMHCDIGPRSDCALFFDLDPTDHHWPFLVERDAGGIAQLATHSGQGVLLETHRTRHGRDGHLGIDRSMGVILRYTRDPATADARAYWAQTPEQDFHPVHVSRLDGRGWHGAASGKVEIDDLPEQPFGTGGHGYRGDFDRLLGVPSGRAEYHVRTADTPGHLHLPGPACIVTLGRPVRGGQVYCDGYELRYGMAGVGEYIVVNPVHSGEQRIIIVYPQEDIP